MDITRKSRGQATLPDLEVAAAALKKERQVNYRHFGRTNWKVGEIGCGMWGMGSWSGSDDEESLRALQRSVDLGCNFFDTAWAYGSGHSEALLGKLLRANPHRKLYTATKIPPKN